MLQSLRRAKKSAIIQEKKVKIRELKRKKKQQTFLESDMLAVVVLSLRTLVAMAMVIKIISSLNGSVNFKIKVKNLANNKEKSHDFITNTN